MHWKEAFGVGPSGTIKGRREKRWKVACQGQERGKEGGTEKGRSRGGLWGGKGSDIGGVFPTGVFGV